MAWNQFLKKIRMYVKPKYLLKSRIRRCRCCGKIAPIIQFGVDDEMRRCLFCRANGRYEYISEAIDELGKLEGKIIFELDDNSPLRKKLKKYGKNYIRSFYSEKIPFGTVLEDGTRNEDIQHLSFSDNSIDLMISSDVLEHVVDINAAFEEMKRVLKPGGKHIFSIPMYDGMTRQRASIEDGRIKYILPKHYHCDPAKDGNGFILVFWDYGKDFATRFSDDRMRISIAKGPFGPDGKIVWCAEKL